MSLIKSLPPRFTIDEVKNFANEYFIPDVEIRTLVSDIGQNFHIKDNDGNEYVFKISNPDERYDMLDMQNKTIQKLNESGLKFNFPSVIKSKNSKEIISVRVSDGKKYNARLLTYLPGTFLSQIKTHSDDLLFNLGKMMGSIDKTLENFYHPSGSRYWHWDLKNALDLRQYTHHIKDAHQKSIAEYFFLQFEFFVIPLLKDLRQGIIHNDANDNNILLEKKSNGVYDIYGLIDFGDMVYSYTIFELAIACAYVMLEKENPVEEILPVVKGYHTINPLTEKELSVLFYLSCTRLASSVTIAAYQQTQQTDNEYLSVTEQPAWNLLEKLISINPVNAENLVRGICGFPALTKSTSGYREIIDKRNKRLSQSLSVSYKEPLKIERGAFQYLFNDKGDSYLDCVNNVSHVGHCHPAVVRAAQNQMTTLNTNTRYLHDYIIEYAEKLSSKFPDPLNVCFFVNSGSEANELAIRLAKTHTGQKDFIVIDNAYHGNTSSVVEISPYKFDGKGGKGAEPHIHKVIMPDTYRGPYRSADPDAAKKYAAHVQESIEQLKKQNKNVAAIFCESLLGCGGQIILPDNYLKQVFKSVRDAGGLCIADEVQVGFGRVGTHFWGFETQDVIPDIVTLGKPIGNGHPLGAVVTTEKIADSFNNGMEYFNTFGGNPVSCATGIAVLDVIEEEKLQHNALMVGAVFLKGLESLKTKHKLIGDVRGRGLFIGLELVKDRESLEPADREASYIIERMKEKGILLSIDGPLYNVIKIKPPIVFTEDNAIQVIETLDEVLQEEPLYKL